IELNAEQTQGAVDTVTLSDALRKKGVLEEAGGQAYLQKLLNSVPSAANIEHYVEIVHQNAVLRRLIKASTEIADKCYEPQQSVKELVDGIESEILSITNLKKADNLVPVSEMILPVSVFR
ncbi:MAG: DnaB-like helicase N-terminal domain-containing protein, partial [Bacteroidales bacterium]